MRMGIFSSDGGRQPGESEDNRVSTIYYCEKCKFLFERFGDPESCPDCGSMAFRIASILEQQEYHRLQCVIAEERESCKMPY